MRLRTGVNTKFSCELVIRCGNAVSMLEVTPKYAFRLLQRPLCEWAGLHRNDEAWQAVGGEPTYERVTQAILDLQVLIEEGSTAQWNGIYLDIVDPKYTAQLHLDDHNMNFDAQALIQTTHIAQKAARALRGISTALKHAAEKDGPLVE